MAGDVFKKVQAGQPLDLSAAAWNSFIDNVRDRKSQNHDQLADALDQVRQADIVKIRNDSGSDLSRFDILGVDLPIITPDANEREFKTQVAMAGVAPEYERHAGRFVVLLDPLRAGKIGRAWASGVCPARINIVEDWHGYADIQNGSSQSLASHPSGAAQILWKEDGTGEKWAVVRISNSHRTSFLAKVPASGIPARQGSQAGSALCEIYTVDDSGNIEPARRPNGETVFVTVRHFGTQQIRGPIDSDKPQFLGVTYDGHYSWLLDPPKQTLICKPTKRLKAKSWGKARELRFSGGSWQPSGAIVDAYNVCDYALLTSQQVVCHFHEDMSAYLAVGCRCCDGSSSSSSSDSSDSSTSESSNSISSSFSSESSGSSYSSSFSESRSDSSDSSTHSSSESRSESVSDSESSVSDSSSSTCISTWIWTCGWELIATTCDDAGEPPVVKGSYDGEVTEVAA